MSLPNSSHPIIEQLESRQMLAWGPYPQLIDQDLAIQKYPGITGKGVNIAVIDTGIDFQHPHLQGVYWVNPNEVRNDGVDNDGNGYVDDVHGYDFYSKDGHPDDNNSHGTQMAGIIAGKKWRASDGFDYQGIAPDAKIISLKVAHPTGTLSDLDFNKRVEQALQWIEANYIRYNIWIVNMSIRSEVEAHFRETFADEVQRLNAKGVLLIASAGHYGKSNTLIWPAQDPNVYSAGMVDVNDRIPEDQQRGPQLNMLAPGSEIPILLKGSAYGVSGEASSYPTPYITGAAALIKQVNPNFTAAQIMSILKDSGKRISDPGGLTYSRLDVDDAIALALQRANPGPGPDPGGSQRPFKGSPFQTGKAIQFEDFDLGGELVSYHDTTRANGKHAYRKTPVGLANIKGGGIFVRTTKAKEWLEYTLDAGSGGLFDFQARLQGTGTGGLFRIEVDGRKLGKSIAVPAGKGKGPWKTITVPKLRLAAGEHVVRIYFEKNSSGGTVGNFDWFRFRGR